MLTEPRWEKEQQLMQSVFPEFAAFTRDSRFGFQGYLKGQRSGRLYRVVLEADRSTYPQYPPDVHMDPKLGHHWYGAGEQRLCVVRDWHAAKSTFANTLLAAIKYLHEHDGELEPIRGTARWD